MKKIIFKSIFVFSMCSLLFSGTGCAKSSSVNSLNKKYGDDACYYEALISLQQKDRSTAERYFRTSIKKSSPVIKYHAMKQYAQLGSVQDRIERSFALYKAFPDESSLLILCKQLHDQKEYSKIINLTKEIDLSTADNQLCFYRIDSLLKKSDSHFENDFYKWCTERNFTAEHYKLYCQLNSCNDAIEFRTQVYTKNYVAACDLAKKLLLSSKYYVPQILSDTGKCFLYGSSNSFSAALYLDELSSKVNDECKFYTNFYAGRLYDKASSYRSRAAYRFLSAMDFASSDKAYDNALWYYLNTLLKDSITSAISALKNYGPTWHDPYYFDDFFETLAVRLFSQHMYKEFYTVSQIIDGFASNEVTAKYCYISARLAQEKIIKLDTSSAGFEIYRLFTRALSSDTDMYYRLMAAKQLNLEGEELSKVIQNFGKRTEVSVNRDAERLLLGYADFGLPEYIFDDWQLYYKEISLDCAQKISLFLQKCGNEVNSYYTQSLRIAARKANYPEETLYPQLLSLVYPQDFKDYVEKNSRDFNQSDYLLYALIRSESFFNPVVVSHAGAVGLTQLMESTASDVARKLKVASYDLKDSAINIRFGSYYLEEMIRRLDGSAILAIFAYNGGITRVRQWVKSANIEFGTKNLPKDLFLEALPFEETREYGRKLVSASAMYGYLYNQISTSEVIEEIMK